MPRALFNKEDRGNIITLPAHRSCNNSFAQDDEYFRLCMTAAAAPVSPQASKLWYGPVMRGYHRPDYPGLKLDTLKNLVPVDVHTEGGIYLGTGEAMLQDAARLQRVVQRIARGLYCRRTGKVLPPAWPVSSDMINGRNAEPFVEHFSVTFFEFGNGTFLYGWKHLEADDREGLYWLIFYGGAVHFWVYTGTEIRSWLPW